jgi:hypothetical protein
MPTAHDNEGQGVLVAEIARYGMGSFAVANPADMFVLKSDRIRTDDLRGGGQRDETLARAVRMRARAVLTPQAQRGMGMVVKVIELAKTHGWFLTHQFESARACLRAKAARPGSAR